MEKESKKNTLDDYCLGYITKDQAPWYENCTYDEKNRQCQGYFPINFSIIYVNPIAERKTA